MARIEVASSSDVRDGQLHPVKLGQRSLLLTRVDGAVKAFENRCPHFGLPLTRGKVSEGTVRCPFHGSRFDICSGRNLDWVNAVVGIPIPEWSRGLLSMGRQPQPLTVFATAEDQGKVYIDMP